VDSPQVAVQVSRAARFRIDVAEDGSTRITVREGQVVLISDEEPVTVSKDQTVTIESGESPRYLLTKALPVDEWDDWNYQRERALAKSKSRRYLPPDATMGAAELDAYGQWTRVVPYGWVWAPAVAAGWAPYQTGRWAWVEPWGWTWVSYEPWGWLPYHYGRWTVVAPIGWAWVPGVRFGVWAPGVVRFMYGPDWVAWVPLGPGEVYYYNPAVSVHYQVTLVNYNVPGAVIIVPHETFVNGVPHRRRFDPPHDPIRAGRLVAGPPPIVPTRDSLRPAPHRVIRPHHLPPRVIQRPVVYRHRPPAPPPRFEVRIKEVQKVVLQGRRPIVVPRDGREQAESSQDSVSRGRIYKDVTVRKPIREAPGPSERSSPPGFETRLSDEQPSSSSPDAGTKKGQPRSFSQFQISLEPQKQREKARPLYIVPPQSPRMQAPPGLQGGGRSNPERRSPTDR
jgi:hypothetical protein